jgi:hypothetical protein
VQELGIVSLKTNKVLRFQYLNLVFAIGEGKHPCQQWNAVFYGLLALSLTAIVGWLLRY